MSTPAAEPAKEELLEQVRYSLTLAAGTLKGMGPGYARIGWMVEDIMTYLDELELPDSFATEEETTDSLPSFISKTVSNSK